MGQTVRKRPTLSQESMKLQPEQWPQGWKKRIKTGDTGYAVETQNRKSYVNFKPSCSIQEGLLDWESRYLGCDRVKFLASIWASVSIFIHQGICTGSCLRALVF